MGSRKRAAGAVVSVIAAVGSLSVASAAVAQTPGAPIAPTQRTANRVPVAKASSSVEPSADTSTLLVQWKERPADAEARLERHGASHEREIYGTGWSVVDTAQGRAADVRRSLEGEPSIAAVEPNLLRHVLNTPNDPHYPSQRAYLAPLRLEKAWAQVGNGNGQKIAVIDTGVDLDHPDLVDRLVAGRDIVNGDNTPWDDYGHGTMVAGIAAATKNNGRGIAGVASGASIMPVKVLDSSGSGSDFDVASGITWATDHGADVINLSLGGPGSTGVLADAIDYALAHDVIVVAAAGNDGTFIDVYPAAYPGVIAVGATGDDGTAAFFTTRGRWVDVSAPGIAIVSTSLGSSESYDSGSGTSFATPIVAGLSALLHRAYPGLDGWKMNSLLRRSARDRGPQGFDEVHGMGTVDAFAAALRFHPAGKPTYGDDLSEPDDTPSRATAQSTHWTASISPEGDEDWFSVDLVAGNWRARITPPGPASEIDPRGLDAIVEVYSPSGELLAFRDQTALDEVETAPFLANTPGSYMIHVRNWASARSPGDYTVDVLSGSSPASTTGPHPWIEDTLPANRAVGVAAGVHPVIDFGRPISTSTVNTDTVWMIDGSSGAGVEIDLQLNLLTGVVTIVPQSCCEPGPYAIRLPGKADSSAGELAETWLHFTVGPRPETIAPNTTITSGPSGTVSTAQASFKVAASEFSTSFCRIDGAPWSQCTVPWTRTVSAGTHTFAAFSVDWPLGNEETTPAKRTWTYEPPYVPPPDGYWMVSSTGSTYAFGTVDDHGDAVDVGVVDLEPTPSGKGYWIVDSVGRVWPFGDARQFGDGGALAAGEQITSLSRTKSGNGYWLFTNRGRVVVRGDARSFGDMSGTPLNGPILDSVSTPSGNGYYMVASDGGVFSFGDAEFYGSMGGQRLNAPVQSLVPDGDGIGYWMVALDGGIFAFDAPFLGSMGGVPLNAPITGMVRNGSGYLMVATDGGIFNFSPKPFYGSLGGVAIPAPIVSVASTG